MNKQQHVEAFLTSVLANNGQGGADRLPYVEDLKASIRQQVTECTTEFHTLDISTDQYFFVDTLREANLIKLGGTIPVWYMNVMYHTPIELWLPELFPKSPPILRLNPTKDMAIKDGHPLVNKSGDVCTRYIQEWLYPGHTLVQLITDTSIQFGSNPPLYSKPAQPSPPPIPSYGNAGQGGSGGAMPSHYGAAISNPQQQQGGVSAEGFNPLAASRPSAKYPTTNPAQHPNTQHTHPYSTANYTANTQNPYQALQNTSPTKSTDPYGRPLTTATSSSAASVDQLESALRSKLITALTQRVEDARRDMAAQHREENVQLLQKQRVLEGRNEEAQAQLAQLQSERSSLEEAVQQYSAACVQIDAWKQRNQSKLAALDTSSGGRAGAGGDIDGAIVPVDAWCLQQLTCTAIDKSMEDTLDVLQQLFVKNKIGHEEYYKQLRQVSRRQFMVRALGIKVAQEQAKRQQYNQSVQPQRQQQDANQMGTFWQ